MALHRGAKPSGEAEDADRRPKSGRGGRPGARVVSPRRGGDRRRRAESGATRVRSAARRLPGRGVRGRPPGERGAADGPAPGRSRGVLPPVPGPEPAARPRPARRRDAPSRSRRGGGDGPGEEREHRPQLLHPRERRTARRVAPGRLDRAAGRLCGPRPARGRRAARQVPRRGVRERPGGGLRPLAPRRVHRLGGPPRRALPRPGAGGL